MKKTDYTTEILSERFSARVRLAITWANHDELEAYSIELLINIENRNLNNIYKIGKSSLKTVDGLRNM